MENDGQEVRYRLFDSCCQHGFTVVALGKRAEGEFRFAKGECRVTAHESRHTFTIAF